MEVFASPGFWLGLGEIAFLNLLLSGDNALVIALAVRALPRRERVLGQVWGAGGAVALRLVFVGVVTYLLRVPFLQFVGGLALLWIAFKLVQAQTGVEHEIRRGASLWEAIWIVLLADVTMSLDNVLAIAAAAHGDMLLIMFGIGLSLPIVMWGAGLLAQLMNRFVWIVWLGGGILGKVAGEMLLGDALVGSWFADVTRPLMAHSRLGTASLHAIPLALGVIVTLVGWWLARSVPRRRRKKVPEHV